MAVASSDDLGVGESAVRQIDVGKRAPVSIGAFPVVLQSNRPTFQHPLRERARFSAEELDRAPRIDGFRCVDTDQTHATDAADDDRVTIDDSFDNLSLSDRRIDQRQRRRSQDTGGSTQEVHGRPPAASEPMAQQSPDRR